jgi:glyoxylase-like metal-dependent hydrolase (beta-lactamase superfamily II)
MTGIFTLEALPARKGDSLILHYGTKAAPKLVVIDGGPSKVYQPALRPRLLDIRAARGIVDTDPLDIDLLMISHIDDDHIKGILEFAKELKESDDLHRPKFARIATLWLRTAVQNSATVAAG